MKRTIAVERSLTPFKNYFSVKGYTVDTVDINSEFTKGMEKYDTIIVTGMNKDFLGVQDINTSAVVIDAKGLTAEQAYREVESRLH